MIQQQLAESDIDRSIISLVLGAPAFSHWLQLRLGLGENARELVRAERSVYRDNGESDVLIEWAGSRGTITCLAESKFNAVFQQRQGERYHDRAAKFAESTETMCVTALIAPADYLNSANPQAAWFNARISLEEIADAADALAPRQDSERATLRALLQRHTERGVLGTKGLFPGIHADIAAAAESRGASLRVSNNATDWVFFKHPAQVAGMEIRYRIKDRCAELAFNSGFRGRVDIVLSDSVRSDFVRATSGKTHFIRSELHDIIPADPTQFRPNHGLVVIDAIVQLMEWWVDQGKAGT